MKRPRSEGSRLFTIEPVERPKSQATRAGVNGDQRSRDADELLARHRHRELDAAFDDAVAADK
jgi:hypothetical protein